MVPMFRWSSRRSTSVWGIFFNVHDNRSSSTAWASSTVCIRVAWAQRFNTDVRLHVHVRERPNPLSSKCDAKIPCRVNSGDSLRWHLQQQAYAIPPHTKSKSHCMCSKNNIYAQSSLRSGHVRWWNQAHKRNNDLAGQMLAQAESWPPDSTENCSPATRQWDPTHGKMWVGSVSLDTFENTADFTSASYINGAPYIAYAIKMQHLDTRHSVRLSSQRMIWSLSSSRTTCSWNATVPTRHSIRCNWLALMC